MVVIFHCACYHSSDTSVSTTTDDIDTVIAKKREVINIKKSKRAKNRQIRGSRSGNGRLSSQDSCEYVKQTIESAREALISTTASTSDSSETESDTEQLLADQTTSKLPNNAQWYVFIRIRSVKNVLCLMKIGKKSRRLLIFKPTRKCQIAPSI